MISRCPGASSYPPSTVDSVTVRFRIHVGGWRRSASRMTASASGDSASGVRRGASDSAARSSCRPGRCATSRSGPGDADGGDPVRGQHRADHQVREPVRRGVRQLLPADHLRDIVVGLRRAAARLDQRVDDGARGAVGESDPQPRRGRDEGWEGEGAAEHRGQAAQQPADDRLDGGPVVSEVVPVRHSREDVLQTGKRVERRRGARRRTREGLLDEPGGLRPEMGHGCSP